MTWEVVAFSFGFVGGGAICFALGYSLGRLR